MKILIATGQLGTLTETFVKAHIEGLSPQPVVAHGFPPQVSGVFSMSTRPSTLYRFLTSWVGGVRPRNSDFAQWVSDLCFVEILRRVRPDVVLAEFGPKAAEIMLACERANVPLVAHFHGADASQHALLQLMKDRYQRLFKVAKAIIAVSRSMQQRLIDMGAPPEKVHYNCYGVDTDVFSGASPGKQPSTALSVGRFVSKKAPQKVIFAFNAVAEQVPNARLRMVGDGPLLSVCRDLVHELRLEDRIELLGALPPEQVLAEMRRSRLLLQHSVVADDGDREGTPNVILEAMSTGLPVVATRHEGIADVVTHGTTGILVEEHDVRGMSEGLAVLCEDPEKATRMGRAARQYICKNHTMADSLSRLSDILVSSTRGYE